MLHFCSLFVKAFACMRLRKTDAIAPGCGQSVKSENNSQNRRESQKGTGVACSAGKGSGRSITNHIAWVCGVWIVTNVWVVTRVVSCSCSGCASSAVSPEGLSCVGDLPQQIYLNVHWWWAPSVYACLNRMLRASQSCWDVVCKCFIVWCCMVSEDVSVPSLPPPLPPSAEAPDGGNQATDLAEQEAVASVLDKVGVFACLSLQDAKSHPYCQESTVLPNLTLACLATKSCNCLLGCSNRFSMCRKHLLGQKQLPMFWTRLVSLQACLCRMLRVICIAKSQPYCQISHWRVFQKTQVPAWLFRQVVHVPAAFAEPEPEAAATVLDEVGVFACLSLQDAKNQPCCKILP